MVITMAQTATEPEIEHVLERVREAGFQPHVTRGAAQTIVAAVGTGGRREQVEALRAAPGVADVVPISQPFKLVSREVRPHDTVVKIGHIRFGGGSQPVIAGPCSVETEAQIHETARSVKAAGAQMLRGGAYKPRTSPYEFQGLGKQALEWLRDAGKANGLPVVTEVMTPSDADLVAEYADMLQIGARNMQNFDLLRTVARNHRPVLLKRGPSAKIKEWLLAAEYVLAGGNKNVVLCERGIRTFETDTRNTLDLAAVALVKQLSHLPVIADPSHGTGRRDLIAPLSRAALAVGADGLIVEVHPCPERAWSDGPQSLDLAEFAAMMKTFPRIAVENAVSA
jgi:3-deoxy-7-phosphoheptulonate synthase